MRVLRISHSAVVTAWRERERELRRTGIDVRMVSARAWDEGGTRVPLEPLRGEMVLGVRTFGSHPALFLYDPRPLWRILGQHWDVLDIHEEPFALATAEILALHRLRTLRKPPVPYLVYSAQNIAKRYPWPFRAFEARILRAAAAVSVCNDEAGRIARGKGAGGIVETIPLGVDLDLFSPGPVTATSPTGPGPAHADTDDARDQDRAPEPSSTAPAVVGYAGRLAPHKGVSVLLDAVCDDDRFRLRIAGGGPQEAELRGRCAAFADRVEFCGSLSDSDLADFYRSLDVLAVPSLTTPGWIEQFGRVAVEAMACGVPVVASDSGALPDVVAGAGLLVPPNDPQALRDALLRIAADPELAAQLGAAGRHRAGDCSWPAVADRYRGLYERIVTDAKTGPASDAGTATPTHPTEPPEVIVVAYGAPDLVRDALTPLAGALPLTVVDNSSLPEIRTVAEELGARYLDPGRNGGFAAGVNHGLAHRQDPDRDVLLLNPDAVVTPTDIEILHRGLRAAGAASAGPVQVDADGTSATVSWPYPSPAATWIEAVGLASLRRTPADRSFVIGSVLLLSTEALATVGGFDERFFLYAEETDWAYRATVQGWRHVVVSDARAVHLGGATSSDPARRETHFHASQERYLRKHYGPSGWQAARVGSVLGAAARSVALRGEPRRSARRRLSLYLRGPVRSETRLLEG